MGSCRHSIWIYLKKIRAALEDGPSGVAGSSSKSIRARNLINKRIKNKLLWIYYNFCAEYGRPVDLDDLCDGLLVIRTKREIQEIYNEPDNR